jgi:hypothetical protein
MKSLVSLLFVMFCASQASAAPPGWSDELVPARAAKKARKHNARGLALHRKGKHAKAVALLKRAVTANPRHVLARYNLACALARGGQPEAALTQLEVLATAGKCRWCGLQLGYAMKDPDLAALAGDPRFVALEEAVPSSYVRENCAEDTGEDDVPVRRPRGATEVLTRTVSPDGRRVAFVARLPGQYDKAPIRLYEKADIWVMSLDGAELHRVTRRGRGTSPDFTPDSKRLFFIEDDSLWTSDLRGRDRRLVVRERLPAEPEGEYDYDAVEAPIVSPDARWVAYLTSNGATSVVRAVRTSGKGAQAVSDEEVYCFAWRDTKLVYKGAEGEYELEWKPQ